MVQYVLGGMIFPVDSAADAYLRDRMERVKQADDDGKTRPEEMVNIAKANSLDEPTPSFTPTRTAATVAVIPGDDQIPQAATLEPSNALE